MLENLNKELAQEEERASKGGMSDGKHRQHKRRTIEDAKRWEEKYRTGESILRIAKDEGTDPKLVSTWLHRLGIEVKQGQHLVPQPPLKYSSESIELVSQGAESVLDYLNRRIWGIGSSRHGRQQLNSFCRFIQMHSQGKGVEAIAKAVGVHRTSVTEWREATDQPYLVKAVNATINAQVKPGWKLLPLHIRSGGNVQTDWITVPEVIASFDQIEDTINQLVPHARMESRAPSFGLNPEQTKMMRPELFAYLLGVLVGDAGKLGGQQTRFASMDLDLQLSQKESSNERFGEFVALVLNTLGLKMERIADKQPTGDTALAEEPTAAFRWTSERSPLLAWMFHVCLGLNWGENTSKDQVHMGWILGTPFEFRKRFIQGMADSDGSVKEYGVVVTSIPNADFTTSLLRSLGLATARTYYENGAPARTYVNAKEATKIPIFNEFVKSYRYKALMRYA